MVEATFLCVIKLRSLFSVVVITAGYGGRIHGTGR
jgi:hypothetical protein